MQQDCDTSGWIVGPAGTNNTDHLSNTDNQLFLMFRYRLYLMSSEGREEMEVIQYTWSIVETWKFRKSLNETWRPVTCMICQYWDYFYNLSVKWETTVYYGLLLLEFFLNLFMHPKESCFSTNSITNTMLNFYQPLFILNLISLLNLLIDAIIFV